MTKSDPKERSPEGASPASPPSANAASAASLVERVARRICETQYCRIGNMMEKLCVKPDGSNDFPCKARRDQLFLSSIWDSAKAAIKEVEASR